MGRPEFADQDSTSTSQLRNIVWEQSLARISYLKQIVDLCQQFDELHSVRSQLEMLRSECQQRLSAAQETVGTLRYRLEAARRSLQVSRLAFAHAQSR